jgi:hypothetical protein
MSARDVLPKTVHENPKEAISKGTKKKKKTGVLATCSVARRYLSLEGNC